MKFIYKDLMYSCGLLDTNWGKIRAKHKYVRWCCGREMGRILIIDFFFLQTDMDCHFLISEFAKFSALEGVFFNMPTRLVVVSRLQVLESHCTDLIGKSQTIFRV